MTCIYRWASQPQPVQPQHLPPCCHPSRHCPTQPASQPPTAGVQTLELAFRFLYLSLADGASSVSSAFKHMSDSSSSSPPGCQPSPAPASPQSLADPPNLRLLQVLTMGPKWTSPPLLSPRALHLPSLCLFPKSSSSRSHTSLPLVWDQNTMLR